MKILVLTAIALSILFPVITGFLTNLFTGFIVGMACILGSSITIAYTNNGRKHG